MDLLPNDSSANKPSRKKRPLLQSTNPEKERKAASKRGPTNEVSEGVQPDIPGNEYRDLRRKCLLLEQENFGLGGELKVVEDDIKTLEDEKLCLLDQLVVLEGLVGPRKERGHRLLH